MTELVGRQLGKYEVQGHIGGGGMAEVYKGYHPGLRRPAAIKLLKSKLSRDPAFVEAFVNEARFAAQLNHPHIVTIYDVGQQANLHYIVMEYIPGQSLQQLIRTQGGLPPRMVCQLFDQIADALNYAHRRGVVHCDVKPNNILLDAEGRARLTDFGIARAVNKARQEREGRQQIGSPRYMSPEHVLNKSLDHRSDIYSLGIVLFEMLTGKVPFGGSNSSQIMRAQVAQRPPPPSTVRPDLPKTVDEVVLRALAKEPTKRYQNALQMARDLRQALLGGAAVPAPPPLGVPEEIVPAKPAEARAAAKRRLPVLPLVAVAALLVAGVALLLPRITQKPAGMAKPTIVVPTVTMVPTAGEVVLPAVTRTAPLVPTATLIPIATLVPAYTSVTPMAVPTVVPTISALYVAPRLLQPADGAGFNENVIQLRWQWSGTLQADEWFDVWVWPRGETERGYTILKEDTTTIVPPGGVGVYFWKVRIVRGKPGAMTGVLSPWSETRSLDYKGPPAGSQPTAAQPVPTRP